MKIQTKLKTLNHNKLTNNTQKVALKLLKAEGDWVSRNKLNNIPSAASRIRELRKDAFGNFTVECVRANVLGRNTANPNVFYYRINPSKVTAKQINKVFRLDKK